MSVAGKQIRNNSFSCVFVVLLMIFSSLASIGLVNNAEASASGDLSITGSTPSADQYIPAYEATYFTVELTNFTLLSEPRTINWYVCIGEKKSHNICISQKLMKGQLDISVDGSG